MTIDSFKSSLYAAASCGAKHISVYDLQVEEKTAFNRWYTPGKFDRTMSRLSLFLELY